MTDSDNRRVTADFPLCSASVAACRPAGGRGGNGGPNTERTVRHLWTAVHKFSSPRLAPFTRSPAERYGSKSEVTSVLRSEVLLLLAAPSMPEEMREEIEARAAAGEKITIQDLTLDEIHIGPRHRQDMGDRQGLADSVDRNVLMQPIGVTADFVLVFDERRDRPAGRRKDGQGSIIFRQDIPSSASAQRHQGCRHRPASPDRWPDETRSPLPPRIVPPIKSRHRTSGGEGAAPFRSTREGPDSRKYAAIRATTLYYTKLKSLLADNQAAPEPHGSQRRGDAMNPQLAVLHPGALTPSDGSRRSVQRALSKADRRLLTDAIQQFAAYVDPDGAASTRPTMAYRNMTAMIYRPAELNALQRASDAAP